LDASSAINQTKLGLYGRCFARHFVPLYSRFC